VIFRYFKVADDQQIESCSGEFCGCARERGLFIWRGVSLIQRFEWITYVFGATLVYSGYKLLRQGETEIHPEKNQFCECFARFFQSRPIMRREILSFGVRALCHAFIRGAAGN